MLNMTRRAELSALPAFSAIPASKTADAAPRASLSPEDVSRQIQHHIDCIQALYQIQDPTIREWSTTVGRDASTGIIALYPYRVQCAFTGDGEYRIGSLGVSRARLTDRIDRGQRIIEVRKVDPYDGTLCEPTDWPLSNFEDSAIERLS